MQGQFVHAVFESFFRQWQERGGRGITNDNLGAARDLYASAAYDDALAVLNRLRSAAHPPSQARTIEQYRAFCLLALGRSAEAQTAIEAVVVANPLYVPSSADVSPRVRAAFSEVRRRLLPGLVQQQVGEPIRGRPR